VNDLAAGLARLAERNRFALRPISGLFCKLTARCGERRFISSDQTLRDGPRTLILL